MTELGSTALPLFKLVKPVTELMSKPMLLVVTSVSRLVAVPTARVLIKSFLQSYEAEDIDPLSVLILGKPRAVFAAKFSEVIVTPVSLLMLALIVGVFAISLIHSYEEIATTEDSVKSEVVPEAIVDLKETNFSSTAA